MRKRCINYEKVKALLEKGKHYQEIAEELEFTKNAIGRYCRKHFGYVQDRGYWKRASFDIPKEEQELLFGSLMGDTCLTRQKLSYTGIIVHSIKQEAYLEHLKQNLPTIGGNVYTNYTSIKGITYEKKSLHIKNNTMLKSLYQSFYYKGKKDVPLTLENLTPRAIAYWFMDDGSKTKKTAIFATCSFSYEGLLRLQSFLQNTYNILTIIRPRNYLYVKTVSAPILRKLIEPYIIPEMYYKIKDIPKLC